MPTPDQYNAGGSLGSAAKQINKDEDLLALLVQLYRDEGREGRADRLARGAGESTSGRQGRIRAMLSSNKKIRREFAVRARQFLTERQAGRAAESTRLRLAAPGRTGSVIASSADLGRPGLSESRGRVAAMLERQLGQSGVLG